MDVLHELVLPKLDGIRKQPSGYMARCPAHDDGKASLSVSRGKEHPVVLHCHAHCDRDDILAAIGLTWNDLCKPREERPQAGEWTPRGPAVAVYDYVDESEKLLYQVLRTADKQFPIRRPDPMRKSGWDWRLGDARRVVYRLPRVLEGIRDGHVIFIAEGEKDVHTLEAQGLVATCNPGGVGQGWRPEYCETFRDADVTIVADQDDAGHSHARKVRDMLTGIARSIRIAEPAVGKDVTDHFAAGKKLPDLVEIWTSEQEAKPDLAPDLWEFIATEDPPYDWVVPDLLERGDRLVWTGFEGLGKALALDTPIPTPKGWTTMGELSVGDEIFGPDGKPGKVVDATGVMHGRPCYRITFSDGAEIVADAQHLWVTETLEAREAAARYAKKTGELKPRGTDQRHKRKHFPRVVTTEEVAASVHARGGHALNHSVMVTQPLHYPAQEVPIDPYALGAWLGDGTSRDAVLTTADPEIIERIRSGGESVKQVNGTKYGWRISDGTRNPRSPHSFMARLRVLGVVQNKHIPRAYLHASVEQRLALLQGLMDTDGTVQEQTKGACVCEFSVCNERLATDVLELLHGLGIKVTMRTGPAKLNGRTVGTRWRLAFQTDLPVFHLKRKAERLAPLRTRRAKLRYITAVEPIESVPVRCIKVDREDRMFLAGRECIPTHNSMAIRQMAVMVAAGLHPFTWKDIPPMKVLLIDCENSESQSRRKFRPLAASSIKFGHRVPDGALRLIHKPEGIDVSRPDDAAWLLERVTAHKPDLLFVGPFYRLHAGNINEEGAARLTVNVLDQARTAANCAMVIEAHAGHGEQGKNRSVRPVGSSLLLRWPEFGFGIAPAYEPEPGEPVKTVDVKPWRGARDQRDWPVRLTWGGEGEWPWKAVTRFTPAPGWEPTTGKDT